MVNKRNTSVDIVRILAFIFVVSVHYFANIGWYAEPIVGIRQFLILNVRNFFEICVPLFLLLTGFLMSRKELSIKFYKGIIKTLIIYVLASVICLVYKKCYLNMEITFLNSIRSILNYSASNYGWYVEMYICLFFTIPFLNVAYNNLKNKKQKQVLIFTCFFLTSLPGLTNVYCFGVDGFWSTPWISQDFVKIRPISFGIYAILYYFIGAYIKEYSINLNKWKNVIIIIIALLAYNIYDYWRMRGTAYIFGFWNSYSSPFVVVNATLFFVFIINIDFNRIAIGLKKIIAKIADCVFGAYLLSYIFDGIVYNIIGEMNIVLKFFIAVPCVCICSLFVSYILNLIYSIMQKGLSNMLDKRGRSRINIE